MANNSISLVNLDFDTLKANLKNYLKTQSQFKDYDFDGSNMSVLLDILTYNTHLNAFYMNMAVSEMFLDSAQLRNSVISRAKELNYTPRSAKSSEAVITTSFPQSNLSIFQIPAGTKFTGKSANGTYTFSTKDTYTIYPTNGRFTDTINIYEGVYTTDVFVVDDTVEGQRFVATNENIDTDSIVVVVSENNGQSNTTYTRTESLYGVGSTSTVYFVQATEDTKYEVVFGDGVFGRRPLNGAAVYVIYRTCSGADADGANIFTLDDNLGPVNGLISFITPDITVDNLSSGGAAAESLESIRFNAPRHFQTQNRAITASDYKNLILTNFNNVKAVNVYGGETVTDSVQYGKIFISPVTNSGAPLSNVDKNNIEVFMRERCTIGLSPQVIDPEYLYLLVSTLVKFDQNSTSDSPADIKNAVNAAIIDFDTNSLTNFDIEFKFSRLETAINDAHPSISSNETSVIMRKDVNPDLNRNSYIQILYRNKIVPGSFYSTTFLSGSEQYQFTDYNPNSDTFSIRQLPGGRVDVINSSNIVYLKNVTNPGYESYATAGTIDYETGEIDLNAIVVNGFIDETSIKFYAQPYNKNIAARGNDLVQIDLTNLNIEVVTV